MGQTTNIGLHQWAAEDPVLRTDFNADFAKIDRAVGAIPLVKLKEVVTTQDAQQLDVDVSDIDFDLYDEVIVYAELVNTKDNNSVSPYCSITINDDTTQKYGCAGSDDMNSSTTMNNNYILYPGIISSSNYYYYACEPAKLSFKKHGNCLFARCEYGYMAQQSNYYFRCSAGLYKMEDGVPFSKFSITVGNTSNNWIAAGAKLFILGVIK